MSALESFNMRPMQILSTAPLVEKFRSGTFKDEEAGSYFFGFMILTSASWFLAYGEWTVWDFTETLGNVAITILGIHYLKSKNGDTFGNGFLNKYFALGWVISVRLFLTSLPIIVMIYSTIAIVGARDLPGPLGAIFGMTFSLLFYRWLGAEFTRAQRVNSDFVA
jgi:hypothetical protein